MTEDAQEPKSVYAGNKKNISSSSKPKRRFSLELPPSLRLVLLGKNASANSQVGNVMLGRSAFESEFPPDDHHSERVRGKNMTIINCHHLLQPNLLEPQITEGVKECISMCAPGLHVIILILQNHDFYEEDRDRVKNVLKEFSHHAFNRTIVLTTDKETQSYMSTSMEKNQWITDIIKECGGGHLLFDEGQPATWLSEMLKKVDEIRKEELDEYLKCKLSGTSVDPEPMLRSEEDSYSPVTVKSKLNLVLCGTDATLKVTISKLLRGKIKIISQKLFGSSVCVKKEGKVRGYPISVVELPALTQLSDEERICETFNCLSLCYPGVHVFLIIVPVGPLSDKDKEEMEQIQKIFYSSGHFMMIFMTEADVNKTVMDFVELYTECQSLIGVCGGQYRVVGIKERDNFKSISIELLDYIKNMKSEPYSHQLYVRCQERRIRDETEEKYKEERREMESKIQELQIKISSYGVEVEQEDLKQLRIVLIGKTGNGKSATGNTILGQDVFESLASTDSVTTFCEKRVGEVDGQSVAIVDTPGMFDTTMTNEKILDEVMKCVSLSAPGPHVFIIVLSVGRFTQEEADTIGLIRMFFGPKVAQFSLVLFTYGDNLHNEPIEQFVNRSNNSSLKKLLRDCGNRFVAFNNKETQDRTQVTKLFKIIEKMKTTNHRRYFTNSMFEEAEMSIKNKMENILKEKEREINAQNKELKINHGIEIEKMKKRLEEEKRKADEDRAKMESEFKKQKETLRKQFEEKERSDRLNQEKERQKQDAEEKQQKAEYHQKIEEMKTTIKHQRLLNEKQWREREDEYIKREEKYRQDLEEMKEKENIIIRLQKKQEHEIKRRESEEQQRREQEEREREEWTRKLSEAENDRKDIQEEIKRQEREWEEKIKEQMREREEDDRKRKQRHEVQLREKQEELEEMRQTFEKERQQQEEERQKQRQEMEEREREYQEKKNEIIKHYEQLEQERNEMWKRKHREYDERRGEERKKWDKMIDYFKRKQEEQMKRREAQDRERKEKEENERKEIQQEYELRIKEMKKKHEDEARKQAEEFNEFRQKHEQHVQDLQQILEERQRQHELLEKLYEHLKQQKGHKIEELRKEIEKLRHKSSCGIM